MDPYSTYSSRERDEIPPSRLATMRIQLQGMVNRLADDDPVYVNGMTFTADEFRFLLSCLQEPKAPPPKNRQ